jgi:hypothetical protein
MFRRAANVSFSWCFVRPLLLARVVSGRADRPLTSSPLLFAVGAGSDGLTAYYMKAFQCVIYLRPFLCMSQGKPHLCFGSSRLQGWRALQVRHVSLRICAQARRIDDIGRGVVAMMRRHDVEAGHFVAHSFGTFVVAHLMCAPPLRYPSPCARQQLPDHSTSHTNCKLMFVCKVAAVQACV